MSSISPTTLEEFYSGSWEDIKEVLRVLNIGEGMMDKVNQKMVNNYQEMIDRDIDAILNDVYQTPIRAFNQVVVGGDGSGTIPVPAWMENGTQAISANDTEVIVTGKAWMSIPASVMVTISKPVGTSNLYATVREETITTNGFTADLSGSAEADGYILTYIASNKGSQIPVTQGATIRVFPGDVRRAARYWVAGQILINEFQQLEQNITEQATQMVSDARMQVYAFCRATHRIPGQRRKSNISHSMPAALQPNTFPERPS